MITINDVQYRNLQEQVEKNKSDIEYILTQEGVLNEFGIRVTEQVSDISELPTVEDYKEDHTGWEYGDCIAVGDEEPYELYILTRANGSHPNDYWFDLGIFPLPGPQGEQGIQGIQGEPGESIVGPAGPTGPQGIRGNSTKVISEELVNVVGSYTEVTVTNGMVHDIVMSNNSNSNGVYGEVTAIDNYGNATVKTLGSLKGPKGDTGSTGQTGPAGYSFMLVNSNLNPTAGALTTNIDISYFEGTPKVGDLVLSNTESGLYGEVTQINGTLVNVETVGSLKGPAGQTQVIDEDLIPKAFNTYVLGDNTHSYKEVVANKFKSPNSYYEISGANVSGHGQVGIKTTNGQGTDEAKLQLGNTGLYTNKNIAPLSGNTVNLGQAANGFNNLYLDGKIVTEDNLSYGLQLPDTTNYTADKTIATTDDLPELMYNRNYQFIPADVTIDATSQIIYIPESYWTSSGILDNLPKYSYTSDFGTHPTDIVEIVDFTSGTGYVSKVYLVKGYDATNQRVILKPRLWNKINDVWTPEDYLVKYRLVRSFDLATVATSGSYTDLSNKPTIPSVEANSASTPTATLTNIDIDGIVYSIPQGGGGSGVSDVQVNGQSVVTNNVANINLPNKMPNLVIFRTAGQQEIPEYQLYYDSQTGNYTIAPGPHPTLILDYGEPKTSGINFCLVPTLGLVIMTYNENNDTYTQEATVIPSEQWTFTVNNSTVTKNVLIF